LTNILAISGEETRKFSVDTGSRLDAVLEDNIFTNYVLFDKNDVCESYAGSHLVFENMFIVLVKQEKCYEVPLCLNGTAGCTRYLCQKANEYGSVSKCKGDNDIVILELEFEENVTEQDVNATEIVQVFCDATGVDEDDVVVVLTTDEQGHVTAHVFVNGKDNGDKVEEKVNECSQQKQEGCGILKSVKDVRKVDFQEFDHSSSVVASLLVVIASLSLALLSF